MIVFAERIKTLRKKNRHSANAVAENINCSVWTLYKYESGEVEPCLQRLRQLARFYGVTTDSLLGD